jgi:type IV pilus assembly protein PilX
MNAVISSARSTSPQPTYSFVSSHLAINRKGQVGVVLVISLIMLLLLTIIGLSGMQTTVLEEKMTGNSRDQNLAFQSAEAALRAGETKIESLWNVGNGSIQIFCNGTAGLFSRVPGCVNPEPDSAAPVTWADNRKSIASNTGRYFITYIGAYNAAPPTPIIFMVTAKGSGSQSSTQVILRSYYGGDTKWLP